MNKFFISIIIITIITTWVGYNTFMIYGTAMGIIENPIICPIIECPKCPEAVCEICEPCGFGYCNYDVVCNELYCEACPKTFETELKACQDLLLLERNN